jgi:integrase
MTKGRFEDTRDPEIKRDLRSGIYYYRGTPKHKGGEIVRSLKVESFGLAVQAKKTLLIEIRGIDPRAARATFKEYARAFELEYEHRLKSGDVSKSQVGKIKAAIKALGPFFNDYAISQIGQPLFLDYVRYARTENPSRKLENDTVTLNMLMLRAFKARHLPQEITFKNPDPPRAKRRPLTEGEVRGLLDVGSDDVRMLVTIGYTMGMRPGEILSLDWKEVDLDRGFVTILAEKNKNRKSRTIALSKDAWDALRARRLNTKGNAVFPSRYSSQPNLTTIRKPWEAALKDADLDQNLVPYNLRHTAATEMGRRIRAGLTTIVHVCRYLDHDIETFNAHYLHLTEDDTQVVAGLVGLPT